MGRKGSRKNSPVTKKGEREEGRLDHEWGPRATGGFQPKGKKLNTD